MGGCLRTVVVGFALGWVLALAGSCGPTEPSACGPQNCPGCCDAQGVCQPGFLPDACGISGAACTACASSQSCNAGTCASGSGGGGTLSYAGFCAQYSVAYCDALITCKRLQESDRTRCRDLLQAIGCVDDRASIQKGYRKFEPAKAQQCLSELAAAVPSCELTELEGCGSVSSPAAGPGQACFDTSDCADEATACGGATCQSTCQAPGAIGRPCTRDHTCDEGAWCDSDDVTCKAPLALGAACTQTSQCGPDAHCPTTTKACASLPTENQACSNLYTCAAGFYCDGASICRRLPAVGEPCSSGRCVDSAYCDYATGSGVCAARKAVGQTCTATTQCESTLGCISGTCAPRLMEGASCEAFAGTCASGLSCDTVTRTCRKPDYSVDDGEPCTQSTLVCGAGLKCRNVMENADGGVGMVGTCRPATAGDDCHGSYGCPDGAHCAIPDAGFTGVCAVSQVGSPCSSGRNCLAAHYCQRPSGGSAGTCTARSGEGQACSDKSGCVAPFECLSNGTCGTPPERGGAGAACTSTNECMEFLSCLQNVCTPVGFVGQPCLLGVVCFDGLCENADPDAGTPAICGAKGAVGAGCLLSTQCASNLCLDNTCAACP